VLALLVVLTACGTSPPDKPELSTGYNDTDVMFSQMLLNHQTIGAKLLDALAKREAGGEVKTLGAAVAVTEADEAKLVKTWLEGWQKPADVDVLSEAHAAHGGLPSNGQAELDALNSTSDGFDKTFLNIFIGHQHQAVEFARMEIKNGMNREAVALAHRVEQSRQAQIEMMLKMVG
jgi:uncharacterized protein (DUF305 family)